MPTQIELGNYGKPTSSDGEKREESKPIKPGQFLKEVKTEFSKITWPTKEQASREFFAVLFLVFVITGIIFLIDKFFEIAIAFFSGRAF